MSSKNGLVVHMMQFRVRLSSIACGFRLGEPQGAEVGQLRHLVFFTYFASVYFWIYTLFGLIICVCWLVKCVSISNVARTRPVESARCWLSRTCALAVVRGRKGQIGSSFFSWFSSNPCDPRSVAVRSLRQEPDPFSRPALLAAGEERPEAASEASLVWRLQH